ncbi:MAG: DmsC/YnfH family molybdoenzyme membrane anchor subunit [Pseudomonadota bacterium]
MHPAVSVIIFTVTSGAGFGLIMVLGAGLPVPGDGRPLLLSGLAIALAAAGLVSSTFHLGHPERAWRAFSQWRSSWLSREGCLAVASLAVFCLYAAYWIGSGERVALLGWLAAILSLATVYATAMIYAQLKTVPDWYTRWTPACYIAFSLASGFMVLAAFAGDGEASAFARLASGSVLVAWAIKMQWWKRQDSDTMEASGSSVATATGLGGIGDVRLLERPHSGENYLTREMVHKVARKHARKLRRMALIVGAAIPFLFCLTVIWTTLPNALLGLAFLSLMAGLFIERWLFFAEARHSVSLYY